MGSIAAKVNGAISSAISKAYAYWYVLSSELTFYRVSGVRPAVGYSELLKKRPKLGMSL